VVVETEAVVDVGGVASQSEARVDSSDNADDDEMRVALKARSRECCNNDDDGHGGDGDEDGHRAPSRPL
jgi:hypothetical protein